MTATAARAARPAGDGGELAGQPLPVASGARSRGELGPVLAAAALAVLCAPLVVLAPLPTLALLAGAALAGLVAWRPPAAAYVVLALTPLTAGIERGAVLPLLRPGEAVLAVVLAGLGVRAAVALARGAALRLRPNPVEWALLGLALTGSVLPLVVMVARGREVTQDDLFYATYLWKYAAVYLVVRVSIRTEAQVRRCLWILLGGALVVGVVGILQSRGAPGVGGLLASLYTEGQGQERGSDLRGTSTLSSSFAVADVMVFSLAIAAGLARRASFDLRVALAACALVFVLGVGAAAQASGLLALAVGVLVIGLVTGKLRQLALASAAAAALGAVVVGPVFARRLQTLDESGLPAGWTGPNGRWANLTEYFWPELARDLNWLTGVRAAARVPARESWREWVWIESGHTWLLWTGGVLFALACAVFFVVGIAAVARVARRRHDAIGAAALAALVALWVNVVLLTFDVHLTLRGSADMAFALLALAVAGAPALRAGAARGGPGDG